MEVHYDNPEMVENATFETGVQFYYTDKLRPVVIVAITISRPIFEEQRINRILFKFYYTESMIWIF